MPAFKGAGRLNSAALAVATIQTGQAVVHDDHGLGVAFIAELRAFWELAIISRFSGIGLAQLAFILGTLFSDQFLLVFVQALIFDHADTL